MKSRRVLLSSVLVSVIFFGLFLFARHVSAAISVCQCSCVDSESIVTQLAPAPSAGQTCTQSCNAQFQSQQSQLKNAYSKTVNLPGGAVTQCGCDYPSQATTDVYRKKTPGQTTCQADCSAACGGAANVNPDQLQTSNMRQVDCVNDSDCAVGSFASLNQTCEILPASGSNQTLFPFGMPVCIPHVTKKEADDECGHHGGIANGGTCDFVQAGDNPKAYFITKPYINSNGTYAYKDFTSQTAVQGGAGTLWGDMDAWQLPSGAMRGACDIFGRVQDIDFSQIQISTSTATALNQMIRGQDVNLGTGGSKRYACVKRKQDQCGYVTPTIPVGVTVPVKKSSYSCMSTSLITPTTYCITSGKSVTGATVPLADLCTTPNTRCCANNTCLTDSDCGMFKMCNKETGKCVPNPVCDTDNPNRTCRIPSGSELSDPTVCSPEYVITSMHKRCPLKGQACCAPQDATALSSCAIDMRGNSAMFPDGPDSWRDYLCMQTSSVDSNEWMTMPDGSKKLKNPLNGGYCITNDVPKSGVAGSTVSRCGQGSSCCSKKVGGSALASQLAGRKGTGDNCAVNPKLVQYKCRSVDDFVHTDSDATTLGFANKNEYLTSLASSPYCVVTPFSSGGAPSILQNKECVNSNVCCNPSLQPCDPAQANSCNGDPALICDPSFHLCVPKEAMNQQLASQNCVALAKLNGAQSADVDQVISNSGAPESAFSCQSVTANSPGMDTSCIQNGLGCGNTNPLAEANGATILCCAPGIGVAPNVAATAAGTPQAETPTGRTLFRLPACITTGINCTLNDIVFAGASFANFLLAISGAVFLAIFVYAGFNYLTAGTSGRAKQGKEMILKSTIGIVLILISYIFVNFIQSTLISQTAGGGQAVTCGTTDDTKGMQCQLLSASANDANAISAEAQTKGCVRNRCPGPKNYLCCPSTSQ
ncbi:MAG: pilin [Patescibacteria group bacterium]